MTSIASVVGILGLGVGTVSVLAGVAVLIALGIGERGLRLALRPDDRALRERLRSAVSWWVLFLLFAVLLALGRAVLVAALAAMSLLLLRDTLRLAGRLRAYVPAAVVVGGAFLWAWLSPTSLFAGAAPVLAALLVVGEFPQRKRRRDPQRAIRPRSAIVPLIVAMVGPLSAAGVILLPLPAAPGESEEAWLLLLVLLTELNDSAQSWWGRAIGTHPMAPGLSPAKTWEGLVGGFVTTVAATVAVGPILTPYGRQVPFGGSAPGPPWIWAVALGATLAIAGVAGDLIGSRLKREAGVKDSGHLIPGQGGALDRLDSLTVTAPFFLLVSWLLWG